MRLFTPLAWSHLQIFFHGISPWHCCQRLCTPREAPAEEPRGDSEVQSIQEGPLSSNFFRGPQAHPCQEHEQTAHGSVGQMGRGEYIFHPAIDQTSDISDAWK